MGRTLHYTMVKNPAVVVTEADWEKIDRLTQHFIKTYKWTCEEPGFSNINYYPRWPEWYRDSKLPALPGGNTHINIQKWRDIISQEHRSLEERGLTRIQIIRRLLDQKIIALHGDNSKELNLQEAYGFTKVGGNEYNAQLVTRWLTAVSRILPNHEFTLHDEGDFLTDDRIVIKAGKAKSASTHQSGNPVWKDVETFTKIHFKSDTGEI